MWKIGHERIGFTATDDSVTVCYRLADLLTDRTQYLITVSCPEAFIDHMEMIDIEYDCIHGDIFMMLVILFCIPVEVFPVI